MFVLHGIKEGHIQIIYLNHQSSICVKKIHKPFSVCKLDATQRQDEPLPAECFLDIREGREVSIMIEGTIHHEYGPLHDVNMYGFEQEYFADLFVGPELVHVTVVDSGPTRRNNRHFGAIIKRARTPHDQVNQISQLFIKRGTNTYRAFLSFNKPDKDKFLSLVFVRSRNANGKYRTFYGVLHVYRPNAGGNPVQP